MLARARLPGQRVSRVHLRGAAASRVQGPHVPAGGAPSGILDCLIREHRAEGRNELLQPVLGGELQRPWVIVTPVPVGQAGQRRAERPAPGVPPDQECPVEGADVAAVAVAGDAGVAGLLPPDAGSHENSPGSTARTVTAAVYFFPAASALPFQGL